MAYNIGLTGTIASGKSTVGEIFSSLGIEVYSADVVSKALTTKDGAAYKAILARFGDSILLEDGNLNRKHLREIIFLSHQERQWLEGLLHPLIRQQLAQEVKACKTPYCIVEIPLLINKEAYPYLNKILVVTAPLAIQLARIMKRDQCSEAQAMAIIRAHPEDKERLKNADDVLINDAGVRKLRKAVELLHMKYLSEALTY